MLVLRDQTLPHFGKTPSARSAASQMQLRGSSAALALCAPVHSEDRASLVDVITFGKTVFEGPASLGRDPFRVDRVFCRIGSQQFAVSVPGIRRGEPNAEWPAAECQQVGRAHEHKCLAAVPVHLAMLGECVVVLSDSQDKKTRWEVHAVREPDDTVLEDEMALMGLGNDEMTLKIEEWQAHLKTARQSKQGVWQDSKKDISCAKGSMLLKDLHDAVVDAKTSLPDTKHPDEAFSCVDPVMGRVVELTKCHLIALFNICSK